MTLINRYLKNHILKDINKKLIIISGPRQCGKTTFSKLLIPEYDYINYDSSEDRTILLKKSWDRTKPLIIFDEIHKMKNWKSYLKGVYDKEGIPPAIIVTGSARLEMMREAGDSLAGRFFRFRLHPFDVKELCSVLPEEKPDKVLNQLLLLGGFPEPYLENSLDYYHRWRKTNIDSVIRQDLLSLNFVRDISAIETLIELLRTRVGSPISYSSLARDLQYDPKTIKNWLKILEDLYIIFKITPYHKNVARSLLKEPKYYFYDTGIVLGDKGIKLENLVACSLLKECQFLEDYLGIDYNLNYLKNKQGQEVDFFVGINNKFTLLEVKYSDNNLSKNIVYFKNIFPTAKAVQIVKNCNREHTFENSIEIRNCANWLANLQLI